MHLVGILFPHTFTLVRFQWNFNFLDRFFRKILQTYENPSSGRRIVPCRRTDGLTDMTTLIVAFLNFENASKNFNYGLSLFVYKAKLDCGYLCTFTATNFGNSGFRVTVYVKPRPVITARTTRINMQKFYIPSTKQNFVFYMHLRTNRDYFSTLYLALGFYNEDGQCLLHSTRCFLKWYHVNFRLWRVRYGLSDVRHIA